MTMLKLKLPIERSCLFCTHFNFDMGSPGYSEYTPGTDARFQCYKEHWEMENFSDDVNKFAQNIAKAETCKDFEPHK